MIKVCTKCSAGKPATEEFFILDRGKPRSKCKPCYLADQRARYASTVERYSARHAANRERNLANNKAWREANADKIRCRARERYRTNPQYRLRMVVRAGLRESLGRNKASKNTEALLGYTMATLRSHLERQFLPGMSWANYGDWHVDHIVPLASFNFSTADDPEFRACWALTNLRPLWATDNVSKSDKRVLLL